MTNTNTCERSTAKFQPSPKGGGVPRFAHLRAGGVLAPGHWSRHLLSLLAATLLMTLAGCTLFGSAPSATPTPKPTLPPLPPSPLTAILPPPPTNCPPSPPLSSITAQPGGYSQPVKMYGQSPLWIPEEYLPQGTVPLNPPGTPVPYPSAKILWEEGPGQDPAVTARVTDLSTGDVGWWSTQGSKPQTQVLTLGGDALTGGSDEFVEQRSVLYLTHAGCFSLDVKWSGAEGSNRGEWYIIFAAGGSA